MTYSAKGDTTPTKRLIDEHNATGRALNCRSWGP